MATYTYYGFNLISGDILAELPLKGASPSWTVNDPGDLASPSINLDGLTRAKRADIRTATVPYRCGIAVERDGTIIWAGIVTARRYSSSTGTFALTVPGLLAYWRRRLVTTNRVYAAMDQFDIVADLLTLGGGPTVPLTLKYDPSGVKRDRNIDATDQKTVFDAIMEIADNIDGYEIAIESEWATSGAQRVLHNLLLGSPRLGRAAAQGALLMLEYPGNVREYSWDEDGEEFATEIWGQSTSAEGVTITRTGVNDTLLGLGFPRVATARQWDSISDVSTLDGHIVQALAEADGYQDAPTFTVPDRDDTAIGSWNVGDDVRLRIRDSRRFSDPANLSTTAAQIDTVVRIETATLNPEVGTIALTAFGFPEAVQ